MSKINLSELHGLTQEEVITRLERRVPNILLKFGEEVGEPEIEWTGPRVNFKSKVKGFMIPGKIEVTKTHIHFEAKIPFVAIPFKNKILAEVRKEIEAILA